MLSTKTLEFAVANLKDRGLDAKIENNTVYVIINDNELELAQYEIAFQSDEWRKKQKENQ